jgi:predicted dehydrogenase
MNPSYRPLQVAMLGIGDITSLHRPAYVDFEAACLHTICDLDEHLLAERARAWHVPHTTTDYRTVLADPQIDIVEVNTPHHLHRQLVVEALAAGKHVACQKPMATRISDCEAMIAAAQQAQGKLRILENFVFYPPYVKAKELLDGGEIGTVLSIRFKIGTSIFGGRWIPLRSELWHLLEVEKGMGQAVFDDGFHKLSLAIHLVGEIDAVKGFIDRSFVYADEPAQCIWRYKDSAALGSLDIAFSPNLAVRSKYFPVDERIDIVGTTGLLQLTCCTGQTIDEAALVLYKQGRRYVFDELETDWQASFTAGIRAFPLAIQQGRDTLISGQRALAITRFAYALIMAAHRGSEVRPAGLTDEEIAACLDKS